MQKTAKQLLSPPTPALPIALPTALPGSLTHAQCEREVVELHVFFQAWLDGSLPATDAVFARFTGTAHPDLTLISPDGALAGLGPTAAWIRAAHAARPGVRLWTTDHRLHHADANTAVMTYREWQTNAGITTLRLSTAVLCAAPAAPNGVAWLHIHETWLPLPAAPDAVSPAGTPTGD